MSSSLQAHLLSVRILTNLTLPDLSNTDDDTDEAQSNMSRTQPYSCVAQAWLTSIPGWSSVMAVFHTKAELSMDISSSVNGPLEDPAGFVLT